MILKVLRGEHGAGYQNMIIGHFPRMALFSQELRFAEDGSCPDVVVVTFRSPDAERPRQIEVSLAPQTSHLAVVDVILHQSPTKAYNMGDPYNHWFSSCFGFEVVDVYIGTHLRPVLGNLSPNADERAGSITNQWLSTIASHLTPVGSTRAGLRDGITFADVAPYLIVTAESLEDVSSRLPDGEHMDMTKFRPNVVLSGSTAAYDEDYWGELAFHRARFSDDECESVSIVLTQNCARCVSINVSYATGMPESGESGSMLKKLMKDRRVDKGTKFSPIFGRYGFMKNSSPEVDRISVGDIVSVTRRNSERTTFSEWSRHSSRQSYVRAE